MCYHVLSCVVWRCQGQPCENVSAGGAGTSVAPSTAMRGLSALRQSGVPLAPTTFISWGLSLKMEECARVCRILDLKYQLHEPVDF